MDERVRARLRSWLVWIAGGALLFAAAVDVLAMLGRQLRLPLIGSIELVEAAVLVAAAGALVVATVDGVHARVNLLIERMSQATRARVETLHTLAALALYAALLAGTVVIAVDLWSGHEESELLRIPYRPLRVATACCFAALLVLALRRLVQLLRRSPRP